MYIRQRVGHFLYLRTFMKFLILRFSAIGDIVLSTPVVRCLKKKFPDAGIHYATKRAYHTVVKSNPYISQVHLLDDSIFSLISQLKQQKFDYIIDLHNNQRTWLIKTMLGVKSSSFYKINFEKWVMVNFKVNMLPHKHIVDRYMDTCTSLGVENDGAGLDYFIPADEEVDIFSLPPAFHKGYVTWAIGGTSNTKQYPPLKIAHAINKISLPVVVMGGDVDTANAAQIMAAVNNKMVFNACGKYTLNQSASIVRQASLMVANDTGLMHIASAFKKPVFSIWGNTIPQFGMDPYYGKDKVPAITRQFETPGLSCRPCSKLGYDKCPKGHYNCMNMINELEIAGAVNAMPASYLVSRP